MDKSTGSQAVDVIRFHVKELKDLGHFKLSCVAETYYKFVLFCYFQQLYNYSDNRISKKKTTMIFRNTIRKKNDKKLCIKDLVKLS